MKKKLSGACTTFNKQIAPTLQRHLAPKKAVKKIIKYLYFILLYFTLFFNKIIKKKLMVKIT